MPSAPDIHLTEHAAFALRLLDFFQAALEDDTRLWQSTSLARRVAVTCQIVEAFYHLNLPDFQTSFAPTLKWLKQLEPAERLFAEDARSVQLYPSRFKTFALLNDFDEPALKRDFQELAKLFTSPPGMITNLPSGMLPELATLIWVDTLLLLEQDEWNISKYRARLKLALHGIERAFAEWLANKPHKQTPSRKMRLALHDDGDASYAFDILTRHGILRAPKRAQARAKLIQLVRQSGTVDLRNYAPIYCAIQLATHFGDSDARSAIYEQLNRLNDWFKEQPAGNFPLDLAALTLRLLARTYPQVLSQHIFRVNLDYRRKSERERLRAAETRQDRELEHILRSTFQIEIGGREIISGTRSQNKVLRVRFGFRTDATTESGDHESQDKNALRLIIKQGSVESLRRAIASYNLLDPELRRYFARHTASIAPQSDLPNAPWYLIMEDLGNAKPLSETLTALDVAPFSSHERAQLAHATRAVAEAFHALHHTTQPLHTNAATNHVERLYFLPITENIDFLCEPSQFPRLKQFVVDGFDANEIAYRRLALILNTLRPHQEKALRLPFLTQIHGDAHSRNIMLDAELRAAKFVDVETMGNGQDYLMDYALLLEDVLFYRALPSENAHSESPLWQIQQSSAPTVNTKSRVRYPAFPQRNQAALFFQHELLQQLKTFAEKMNDSQWKPRLWLAIAKSLILLVVRQTNSKRLEAQRPRDVERVIIAYAEAMRLLNELGSVLEAQGRLELPDTPFGERRIVAPEDPRALVVRQLKEILAQLPGVTLKHNQKPAWIDYHIFDNSKPFAQLQFKSKADEAKLHFFVPLQSLVNAAALPIDVRSEHPGIYLSHLNAQTIPLLRPLIVSAYEWSLAQRRA